MAIDTEDKRRSVSVRYGQFTIMPVADGTIDQADQPQARWLYRGFTYQSSAQVARRAWMDFDYYRTEYR
jgi:hypothetical protein